MSENRFTTFAYGSNMPTARIRARCPSAKLLGVAKLPGYQLRWHKSSKDGSGKCDIVVSPDPQEFVLGVLYEITGEEKPDLDRAEGLGKGYKEIDLPVLCEGTPVPSKVYQATAIDAMLKPYTWYRALVVAGAREHRLSSDYIARLEAVPAIEDPDRGRHQANMRLIEEAEV